jgi:hypothetical protein
MPLKFCPAAHRAEVIPLSVKYQGFPDLFGAKPHFAHRIDHGVFGAVHAVCYPFARAISLAHRELLNSKHFLGAYVSAPLESALRIWALKSKIFTALFYSWTESKPAE